MAEWESVLTPRGGDLDERRPASSIGPRSSGHSQHAPPSSRAVPEAFLHTQRLGCRPSNPQSHASGSKGRTAAPAASFKSPLSKLPRPAQPHHSRACTTEAVPIGRQRLPIPNPIPLLDPRHRTVTQRAPAYSIVTVSSWHTGRASAVKLRAVTGRRGGGVRNVGSMRRGMAQMVYSPGPGKVTHTE